MWDLVSFQDWDHAWARTGTRSGIMFGDKWLPASVLWLQDQVTPVEIRSELCEDLRCPTVLWLLVQIIDQ